MSWRPRHTEEQVRDAVATSKSMAQTLRALGLRAAGGNFRTLKKLVAHYGVATDHFDPKWSLAAITNKATPLTEILVEDSHYNRANLKRRLYDVGLKHRQCEMCGQGEEWRGQAMSLILDHINGVPTDNRLENLRIVCPNCAATLDTHCGRKNRLERGPRNCLHCGDTFIPKRASQRYCSRDCGVHSGRPRAAQPERRKVERPSFAQLKRDIASMSFLAVGRKYGVSDNAIRKWLRWYEYEAEQELARDEGEHPDQQRAA